jgi:hypothetical protein
MCCVIVSASEAAAQLPTGDTSANGHISRLQGTCGRPGGQRAIVQPGKLFAGIVIGLASVGQYLSPPEWQSCAPATSDVRQLARIIVNYIEAHPERLHEDLRWLTLEAFHDAWPCKSSR